jgi:dihydrofolate synthase/folylpolyglutamate synthase
MNYQQTLDYLYSQLPMFHRIGKAAYKADLNNSLVLAQYLGNPEKKFRSIHIAGTNGKGSVAHMLASVFQEAGYKTGLCTSPHLKDFRERFRVNGAMMSRDFLMEFVEKHKHFFEKVQPSFFEMTIAMTFDYFASEMVDIAIVETGLGGRLDSTNIITPELSVITNIGLDHTNLLGDSIEAIAREKAGIIKNSVPVVLGRTRARAREVIAEKAYECKSEIFFAEEEYAVINTSKVFEDNVPMLRFSLKGKGERRKLLSSLTGTYQFENICTVASAVDVINKQTDFRISEKSFRLGIQNVVSNTGIMGRWQVLSQDPLVICDTGHNLDGMKKVLENISGIVYDKLHFVLGMMADKDVSEILEILPHKDTIYYYCKPEVPRGLNADTLLGYATAMGLEGTSWQSVKDAYQSAVSAAANNDLVFIGGSSFVVAEVL